MNFATLDLNLLRVLDALFREGSTVAAARRLGLSQPAVSGALARLRHALDDPLFVRHGNRLVTTDYARALQEPLRAELDRLQAPLPPPPRFHPANARGHSPPARPRRRGGLRDNTRPLSPRIARATAQAYQIDRPRRYRRHQGEGRHRQDNRQTHSISTL